LIAGLTSLSHSPTSCAKLDGDEPVAEPLTEEYVDDFKRFDERQYQRIERWLKELRAWRNARVESISSWTFIGQDGQRHELAVGDAWPTVDTPVNLTATATIPQDWAGERVEIELWLGGEGFVTFTPGYQTGLNPYHHDFDISDAAQGGESIEIRAEVVPKGMFGTHVSNPAVSRAVLTMPHDNVRALETDLRMIVETAAQLKDHQAFPLFLNLADDAYRELAPFWPSSTEIASVRYISGDEDGGNTGDVGSDGRSDPGFEGARLLPNIWHIPPPHGKLEPLPEAALAACDRARDVIASGLEDIKQRYPPIGKLRLSGHAHIDLAWLWPVAETRRKVRRTWSSMLHLMEKYDEFTFNQSSAQAYKWMEDDDPELLERIKERVAEGRWETVGGSWAEPDCQVTGGEAFARQLFYGQRYFEQTFGSRNTVAWLPDVFGFSGGIPQMLQSAGITGFFTTKLNWNEDNAFPYDLFWWEGVDGSKVLAHSFLNPHGGYNGHINPEDTWETWKNFIGKRLHDETLLAFGWGDGGGGSTDEMLRNYPRIKDYPVLPKLEMGRVDAFYESLPRENLPTYVGEMYLELHRATLTTQGLVKQLNRQAEHRLVEAEAFSAIAALDGADYPFETLDSAWQDLLYNQFHDVLPGSSIHEVYADTHPQLQAVVATAIAARDNALSALTGAGTDTFAISNPDINARPMTAVLPSGADAGSLPSQIVEDGVLVHDPMVSINGFATQVVPDSASSGTPATNVSVQTHDDGITIENDTLVVEIGSDGTLHRVFDKRAGRETLSERGNQLWAYVDRPRAWDAWDIDESYRNIGMEITDVDSIEETEKGPLRAAVRVTRTWRSSTFVQTYRLLSGSSRIDIDTKIDWHERLMLVRSLFPTTIHSHEATFETMYGVHKRATHTNTTWERSRFEVSAHRFVDLSEPGYGVALLNDAKYGHSAVDNTLGISLVRGPLYPDPFADEGPHHFTYSLYPHTGNWVDGGVTREARVLNAPLVVTSTSSESEHQDSFVTSAGHEIGLGTLKRAHERNAVVLRVYEPHGARGNVTLDFASAPSTVQRSSILEEPTSASAIDLDGSRAEFEIKPFEIVTLIIEQ
jgi:alpha-mannosidase